MIRHILTLALALAMVSPANVFAFAQGGDDTMDTCINLYYGIGGPIDYQKAYKCFEPQRDQSDEALAFVIVMQLNGQGVPPSAAGARQIFKDWQKVHPGEDGLFFKNGSRLWPILFRDQSPKLPLTQKLDYCTDVAQSMAEDRFCDAIEATLAKQDSDKTLAAIRARLPSDEALAWDRMVQAFMDYDQAEASRADAAYSPGSGAPAVAIKQGERVRKDFAAFMSRVFGDMKLAPASQADLTKAESELKAAYDSDVAKRGDTTKDTDPNDAKYARAYVVSAADSQKIWKGYRDLCVAFAEQVYKNKGASFDPGLSIKQALTRIRIEEIKAPL